MHWIGLVWKKCPVSNLQYFLYLCSFGRNKKWVLNLWNIFERIWLQSKTWQLIRMELWWSVYQRTNMEKFLMWSILTWSIFWLLISHQKLQLGCTNQETLYRYSSIYFRTLDYKKIIYSSAKKRIKYNLSIFHTTKNGICNSLDIILTFLSTYQPLRGHFWIT